MATNTANAVWYKKSLPRATVVMSDPLIEVGDEMRSPASIKMPLGGKKLRQIRKIFESENFTIWGNDEECSLFIDLALEVNSA